MRARAELERLLVEESGIASFDKLTALVDDVIANRSMEFVSLSQQMNDLCKQRVLQLWKRLPSLSEFLKFYGRDLNSSRIAMREVLIKKRREFKTDLTLDSLLKDLVTIE